MHLLTVPPCGRAMVHRHATRDTAVHDVSGRVAICAGERLQYRTDTAAGMMIPSAPDAPCSPLDPLDTCCMVASA